MKVLTCATIVVLAVITGVPSYGQAVTVDNPGFESPVVGGGLGGLQEYNYNSASPDYLVGTSGWYVSEGTNGSGSVTIVNQGLFTLLSPITGDSSNQYIALNGLVANLTILTPGALGGISQVIPTTIGQTYQVGYQAGALSLGVATTNLGQLSAGVDGVTVTSPSGGALVDLGVGTFTGQSFTFVANSTESTLDFYEPSALLANVGGVAIDNVTVTAVPEPKDTMAILLGLGLLLMLGRRLRDQMIKV